MTQILQILLSTLSYSSYSHSTPHSYSAVSMQCLQSQRLKLFRLGLKISTFNYLNILYYLSKIKESQYLIQRSKVDNKIIVFVQIKQMIKYNNKEFSHKQGYLEVEGINQSIQLIHRMSIKNINKCDSTDLDNRRQKTFQSPPRIERLSNNFKGLHEKRSKSHKIEDGKGKLIKIKRQILMKRRQGQSNKDLIIIQNQPELINKIESNHSISMIPPLERISNKHPYIQCSPFKQLNLLRKSHNKTAIKQDIAIGKMKLLTHKSKLSPIMNQKQEMSIHRSEQKFNILQKMQTHHNRFIEMRQREIRLQQVQCEKIFSIDQYLRLTTEQLNIDNIMNIQSIVPNYYPASQKISLQLKSKDKRRVTEPNIQPAEQLYTLQDNETLQDKNTELEADIKSAQRKLLLDTSKQKIKHYVQKFKASKWKKKILLSHAAKFIVPFQTYYYRDFLWKVNYSNKMLVEPPLEYEHRLKVYIGKGNNSPMVRALISRRYWFAFTDRLQEANFVWTQLKQIKYFNIQKPCKSMTDAVKSGDYVVNSILLSDEVLDYKRYFERNKAIEEHSDQRLLPRLKYFNYSSIIKGPSIKQGRMHNHLFNNYIISNKKSLFRLLNSYYKSQGLNPFDFIPTTFNVCLGLQDPTFLSFQRQYHQLAKSIRKGESDRYNFWIIKPGQNTNRGNGIKLCFKLSQIKDIVREKKIWDDGTEKTYIIQNYIQKPFLYQKRKFDLRHYILITCVNGYIKGYWYSLGYVRTTSSQYSLNINTSNIHLTNDAIQKHLPNYGKYQKGNKLSYNQLDAYIRKKTQKFSFYEHVYPQMKRIAIDIMKASANYLDPNRLSNNFQLFGLDFMIDDKLKVWLIEVNSNPCLELSCPILSYIIPNLIENVLQLTIDALYPPAIRYNAKIPRYLGQIEQLNKFELVFDERIQKVHTFEQEILDLNLLGEQQDEFQDDQGEWQDNL